MRERTADYRAARAYAEPYWAAMYAERVRRERAAGIPPLPVALWALMTAVYGFQIWPDIYGTNQTKPNRTEQNGE